MVPGTTYEFNLKKGGRVVVLVSKRAHALFAALVKKGDVDFVIDEAVVKEKQPRKNKEEGTREGEAS
jgi:hypothetical protein